MITAGDRVVTLTTAAGVVTLVVVRTSVVADVVVVVDIV